MNDRLKKVLAAMAKAAKAEKTVPGALTKAQVWKHNDNLTEQDLKVVGGLTAVQALYFPMEDKELAVISSLKKGKAYLNKLESKIGERENFEAAVISTIENKFKGVKVKEYVSKEKSKTKRVLNLILSDLHIGSDIKKDEAGHSFGKLEESRRLAAIVKQVLDYKKQYRDETVLEVLMLGDIIQGQLHDQRDGATTSEQVVRALHLLSQAVQQFAANFKQVNIRCATGNHGRLTSRHKDRAVNQKWDSIETILYSSLKAAASNLKNVTFFIPKTPYVTYDVFGKRVFATHGDTVLNPGYPNKSINVKRLEEQINKINASLKDKDEYSVFVVGHVHTASATFLGNGAVMLTNGAMVPPDEFAISIGLMECQTGQMIFESVEGYPFGDSRFVKVGPENDKDASLDKIITPWESL